MLRGGRGGSRLNSHDFASGDSTVIFGMKGKLSFVVNAFTIVIQLRALPAAWAHPIARRKDGSTVIWMPLLLIVASETRPPDQSIYLAQTR